MVCIYLISNNSLTEKRAMEEGISIHSFGTKQKFTELMKNIIPLFVKLMPQIVISITHLIGK